MTHQFFLSHRSIYLVVFNLLDQNYEQIIFYWINSLKTRIKNPPVVIVGTHVDAPSVDRVKVIPRSHVRVCGVDRLRRRAK